MIRRKLTSKFQTKVVIEALKERMSAAELAQEYELAPQQISTWKREFLDNAEKVFGGKMKNKKDAAQEEKDALLKVIGQQKVELDFLKKALA